METIDKKAWLTKHGIMGIHVAPYDYSGTWRYNNTTLFVRSNTYDGAVAKLYDRVKDELFLIINNEPF